jgi:hypothetical protein
MISTSDEPKLTASFFDVESISARIDIAISSGVVR